MSTEARNLSGRTDLARDEGGAREAPRHRHFRVPLPGVGVDVVRLDARVHLQACPLSTLE